MTSHKNEEIYYKTDHHWTTLGAKYAFDALSTALGIDSPTQEYTIYPVTHSFQGTLTSKSGYDKGMDTIELYIPQNVNTDCVVNFVDEGKRTASMYESAALENKVNMKYSSEETIPALTFPRPWKERKIFAFQRLLRKLLHSFPGALLQKHHCH